MFLPPHLRLQTAAYLPQEAERLYFTRCEATRETSLPFIEFIAAGEKVERDKPRQLHTHCKFIRNAPAYLRGQTNKQIP